MTRKAKGKASDYAIAMDEFHPNPSTAAAFADMNAHDAAEKQALADLRRNERRVPTDSSSKKAIRAEWLMLKERLRTIRADREATAKVIEEAKAK